MQFGYLNNTTFKISKNFKNSRISQIKAEEYAKKAS